MMLSSLPAYFFFAAGFFSAAFLGAGAAAAFLAAGFFAAVAILNHHPSGVISTSTTVENEGHGGMEIVKAQLIKIANCACVGE